MEIFWVTLLVFVLYARVLNYHFMIDDIVRRWGYLYDVPNVSPAYSFYNSKPSKWRHLFPIITHALNVIVINALWGWKVALIFAVHPLSVPATAWITGGYYSVTAFLTLTAYYFVHTYGLLGGLVGSVFYTAALGSTITCIGIPFLFLFQEHQGLWLFWPLLTYLVGKRFLTGFAIRNSGRKDNITWRKLAVMPKVTAYYILIALVPNQLCFFRQFGFEYSRNSKMKTDVDSFNFEFYLSTALVLAFAVTGWLVSPFAMLWFFVTILPFSQFKMLGQFIAERYSYLPNVGIAIFLGTLLEPHPYLFTIVTTLFLYRSHIYIPAYRHMRDLYLDGIKQYPDCVTNYANLAELYLQSGEPLNAYNTLQKGFQLDPDCFLLHCNMAAYWIQVNNLDRGLQHSRRAVEVHADTEDMASKVMRQQCADLQKIQKSRQEEYDRIDAEVAKENRSLARKKVLSGRINRLKTTSSKKRYEDADNKAVEKAKEIVRNNHALIS